MALHLFSCTPFADLNGLVDELVAHVNDVVEDPENRPAIIGCVLLCVRSKVFSDHHRDSEVVTEVVRMIIASFQIVGYPAISVAADVVLLSLPLDASVPFRRKVVVK